MEKFTKIIVDAYFNYMDFKNSVFAPNLFYDSGLGGISTLAKAYNDMPNENFVYFADFINSPYGNKDKKFLTAIVLENLKKLVKIWSPKSIVLACNTATAVCINIIREKFPNIIIIGAEPAIKPALLSDCKNILVLGTKTTIQNSNLIKLFKQNNHKSLTFVGLSTFAKYIDKHIYSEYKINKQIEKEFFKYKNKFDGVVLGCTHYVLIKNNIKKFLSNNPIMFDGNDGISKRLKQCLSLLNMENQSGGYVVFTSSKLNKNEKLKRLFNHLKGGD